MKIPSKQRAILIVEDDVSTASMMKILLREEGYYASIATCPLEVFKKMRIIKPNLILLDFLGEIDCKKIVAAAKLWNIPVVLMTAHQGADDIAKLLGVQIYLKKPFEIDLFYTLVLEQSKADQGSDQQTACKAQCDLDAKSMAGLKPFHIQSNLQQSNLAKKYGT